MSVSRLRKSLLLHLLPFVSGCSAKNDETEAMSLPAVPVVVAAAVKKSVPIEIPTIGNVEAYSTVAIKSRVNGQLQRVPFREGQEVARGDVLFVIDPQPFELALRRAEANLAKDISQAQQARLEAERSALLLTDGVASKEQNELLQANANAMESAVKADRAAVENARVQLEYCTIRAPIDGRTGRILLNEGNLVKENETMLVVINQLVPIYVSFSVNELHLTDILRHMATGPLKVFARSPGEASHQAEGTLTFVDNSVDRETGTIRLKATYENKDRLLWPGEYVNVHLRLAEREGAILVPSQAIQTGQKGEYVYAVKDDLIAELWPVITGGTFDGQALIEKGLEAGERVVIDGQLRLVPGVKVELRGSRASGSEAGR